ncbi:MAG: ornithine carbamoyltransferase [Treponema sp.]
METFKAPFKGRSLLNWIDWTPQEINSLLDIGFQIKAEAHRGEIHQRFLGKTIALIFEKRSTRTRSAFETAFGEEGGHPVFMSLADIQLGGKESVKDTARTLGRMFSAIEFRGFQQKHAKELAEYAGIPVINGLTDAFHPTQALADLMTLKETFGDVKGLKLVFCGDGRNNVARSLMLISAKFGIHFSVFCPKELRPDDEIRAICKPFAEKSGARIEIGDKSDIVKNADCLYTDVWVSMGEENLQEERVKLLSPFQVNQKLMKAAGKNAVFMHCLPAVKGQEVTEEVFESALSRVWEQAENRKHSIKAVMLAVI